MSVVESLISRARREIPDEKQPYIFSDDFLQDLANEAQDDITRDLANIGAASKLETSTTLNYTAGTRTVAVPADCLKVVRVEMLYNGEYSVIPIIRLRGIDEAANTPIWNTAADVQGTPKQVFLYGGSFYLDPTPDATLASGLKVYYIRIPATMDTATESPEILSPYHTLVKDYIVATALEQLNPGRAALTMAKYERRKSRHLHQQQTLDREDYPKTRVVRKY